MFTPQQLDQISFEKARFGGYDMESVDEFLEPLIQDYETLYKENATLKSKMRILVEKLEEYRKNESSVKEALMNAQRTSENMVREAEAKCLQMLNSAEATAGVKAAETDFQAEKANAQAAVAIAAENQRLAAAKQTAVKTISVLEAQLEACLGQLRAAKASVESGETISAPEATENAGSMADEISQNLERLVGADEEVNPRPAVRPTKTESNTAKFANLQFGKNYDPRK